VPMGSMNVTKIGARETQSKSESAKSSNHPPQHIIMKVSFKEIGRDKKSWEKEFGSTVTESAIAKEAKRGGSLMSSGVDAEIDDSGHTGTILVGGWRPVGTFTIS